MWKVDLKPEVTFSLFAYLYDKVEETWRPKADIKPLLKGQIALNNFKCPYLIASETALNIKLYQRAFWLPVSLPSIAVQKNLDMLWQSVWRIGHISKVKMKPPNLKYIYVFIPIPIKLFTKWCTKLLLWHLHDMKSFHMSKITMTHSVCPKYDIGVFVSWHKGHTVSF